MRRWIAPAALFATALLVTGCMEPPARQKSTLSAQTGSPTTAPAGVPSTNGSPPASQLPPDTELHPPTHHNFPALMAYRPIYVLVGPEVPNVKFQFSTKVPLLFPGGPDEPDPVLSNIYFGYTQMSLWDIQEPGKATIDTTFMPELFFATQTPLTDFRGFYVSGAGLQGGFQHESNGRSAPPRATRITSTSSRLFSSATARTCTGSWR